MQKVGDFETQIVIYESIIGPQPRLAPAGWKFDKTAIHVWVKLVNRTRELDNLKYGYKKPTQKELRFIEGQVEALSNVLASSLGMAGFYWKNVAKVFEIHERHAIFAEQDSSRNGLA